MATSLILTSEASITLASLNALVADNQVSPDSVAVATSSSSSNIQVTGSAYETIISVGGVGHHTVDFLGRLTPALRPAGKLIITEPDSDTLRKNILLTGFTNTSTTSSGAITATKPNWETGTKAAISLKPKNTWTVAADDENDELVDEDELLTEDDLKRPGVASKGECGTGKKACANCTCGRADGSAPEVKLTKEMLENPQPAGGCGSCSLGDAFRCAGCPYRGLPAFEPGKPIQLSSDFLVADA